jgi:tetratricopeptide (TPR) repeat protein
MESSSSQFWQILVQLVASPGQTLWGLLEYGMTWISTREWLKALVFLPALLILIAFGSVLTYGRFMDVGLISERYLALFDEIQAATSSGDENRKAGEDSPLSDSKSETSSSSLLLAEDDLAPFAEDLLLRVLQLENSNTRATYLVAAQLARQGRLGQARQLMRSISDVGASGFPPAHAWLAADRVTRLGVQSEVEKQELLADLEIAIQWEGTGPLLISIYADLLEQEQRVAEALELLANASKKEPRLLPKLAAMAQKQDRSQYQQYLDQALAASQARIEELQPSNTATPADYATLARVTLLKEDFDAAIDAVRAGLALNGNDRELRRLLSEIYRLKYRQSLTPNSADIAMLDLALQADPTNPAISEDVAALVAMGNSASPELVGLLQQQLSSGRATALTHLLLANRSLRTGDLAVALPHLELAHAKAPNSPVILNNLAVVLARTDPGQLPRALELIQSAIRLSPPSAELLDSLGELQMLAGETVKAVTSFESAIGLDGSRINTREKLVEAYDKLGLKDMAEVQRKAIQKMQTSPNADDPSTPNSGAIPITNASAADPSE